MFPTFQDALIDIKLKLFPKRNVAMTTWGSVFGFNVYSNEEKFVKCALCTCK